MMIKMDAELKNKITKTGTTTIGIVCKDGIVIAADTRGTFGSNEGVSYIAAGDEKKIEKINDRILVTIAGVASDLQKIIKLTRAELKLKELRDKRISTVKEAAGLFSTLVYQNIRQFSPILGVTHFLLSGYDYKGTSLYEILPDGYLREVKKFSATGSGMIQCNPLLDAEYRDDLSLQEGIKLALKCVNAAMKRDPGTGEGIEIYTVKKDAIKLEIKEKIEPRHVKEEDNESK